VYVFVYQTFNILTILMLSKYFTLFLYRTQVNKFGHEIILFLWHNITETGGTISPKYKTLKQGWKVLERPW